VYPEFPVGIEVGMHRSLETSMTDTESSKPGGGFTKIALAVVAVAAFLLVGREAAGLLQDFAAFVEGIGIWAPVVFIAGYALAVVALIPGSLLTLAGGAIFGLLQGTIYVFIAAVIGSIGGFTIARYVARSAVEERISSDERFAAVDSAVGENGFKIVFLLRMSPVFPFSFLNYALGLTRVSLRDYALASFGMIPGTLLYVYYGKVIGDVAALADGAPEGGSEQLWVTGLGLVATIAVTTIVTRIAKRALDEATGRATAPAALGTEDENVS